MIVDEMQSEREELARALEAEGFKVVQSDSPAGAVRALWEGTFIVVFIASILSGSGSSALADELSSMAPEIETHVYSKSDHHSRLVRKAIEIRDGVAAA
jgi:DNA-binding NtrC family response regulator